MKGLSLLFRYCGNPYSPHRQRRAAGALIATLMRDYRVSQAALYRYLAPRRGQ